MSVENVSALTKHAEVIKDQTLKARSCAPSPFRKNALPDFDPCSPLHLSLARYASELRLGEPRSQAKAVPRQRSTSPRPLCLSACSRRLRSDARDESQFTRARRGRDLPASLGRERKTTRLKPCRITAGNRRLCRRRICVESPPRDCQWRSLRANPEHLVALGSRDHADSIPAGPDVAVSVDVPRPEPERIRVRIARRLCADRFRHEAYRRLSSGCRWRPTRRQRHDADKEECASHDVRRYRS